MTSVPEAPTGARARIESVDSVRVLAILAVIAIHTVPFKTTGAPLGSQLDLAVAVNQLARFSVPFFFVVSGYFWGIKIGRVAEDIFDVSTAMCRRLFLLFVAWSMVYLLSFDMGAFMSQGILGQIKVAYWNLVALLRDPLRLLFEGTRTHLWFLVALGCSIAISAAFIRLKAVAPLITISVLFYLFGLMAGAYADSPIGMKILFNTRNGPFFGLIFFVSGYLLSQAKANGSWLYKGVILLFVGCMSHFCELRLLNEKFGTSYFQDYTAGTYLMGLGSAMVALSNVSILRVKVLSSLGEYVLGIYLLHVVFVELLRPVDRLTSSPVWGISYVFIVFFCSLLIVRFLSRFELSRKVVL